MLAAAYLAPYESSRFQHADVARYAGECHRQRSGQVGDAGVTLAQRLQQPATVGSASAAYARSNNRSSTILLTITVARDLLEEDIQLKC